MVIVDTMERGQTETTMVTVDTMERGTHRNYYGDCRHIETTMVTVDTLKPLW